MKNLYSLLLLVACCATSFAQTKNFIDQPYLETQATVDTLITPDRIHLTIVLDEADSKNRKSTERLEADMIKVLKKLNLDIDEDLTVADFDSDYRKYFLRSKKVLKTKIYYLVVKDAFTLSKVFIGLEEEDISNVSIRKTEYSKEDELLLSLKSKAILEAKANADALVTPLGQKLGKAIMVSDQTRFYSRVAEKNVELSMGLISNSDNLSPEIAKINFQDLKFSATVNVTFALE
jgi:hypothetical protein